MRTFYTIMLLISSCGFIFSARLKNRKKKIMSFALTIILIGVFTILMENS